jgi:hypothetical protein
MQPSPFAHSELIWQSCAPIAPPGHEPPLATVWHVVVAAEPFSLPQQTCPVGQSQACEHPKVTTRLPVQPVAFDAQLHVPTIVPPEKPVALKQQSFVRRSQDP